MRAPQVYWLIEMSGMAYGLFADMLGTPNQYRGMLFGSTGRPGCADPKPMWDFWDAFGIEASDMVGWWLEESPVTVIGGGDPFAGEDAVLATSYVIPGNRTLVALASWAATDVAVQLKVDWSALGLDPRQVTTMTAPRIANFQAEKSWPVGALVMVGRGKGYLLVLGAS